MGSSICIVPKLIIPNSLVKKAKCWVFNSLFLRAVWFDAAYIQTIKGQGSSQWAIISLTHWEREIFQCLRGHLTTLQYWTHWHVPTLNLTSQPQELWIVLQCFNYSVVNCIFMRLNIWIINILGSELGLHGVEQYNAALSRLCIVVGLYCALQHSAVQYSALQHSTVQYSAVQ